MERFKKTLSFSLALFFVLTTSCLTQEEHDPRDAQTAIIMINHVNWVVNRINRAENTLMLEHEYEGLSLNSLNLETIKDYETVSQIRTLCNYITELRIDEGERKMLKRELDYNLDNALYSAFPSPASLVAADPYAIAINFVQSTISSYMNYRHTVNDLKIRYERDKWNLDKSLMEVMNNLNNDLFEHQWTLVHNHHLDDYWRVTETQIKNLLEYIDNPIYQNDSSKLYEYLCQKRETYKKLPAFWYYLGHYAEKNGDLKTALEAYDTYQREFCQILRFDRTAATVAMNKILLLINNTTEGKDNHKEIYNQLAIIEKNAEEEWTFLYFCANVYFTQLKDIENATRVLTLAITSQQHQFSSTLYELRELCKAGNLKIEDHTFPNATPLITCKKMMLTINNQDKDIVAIDSILTDFRRDTTKNCFGMLSFLEKLPSDKVESYLSPEVKSIILEYQYDSSLLTSQATYRFVLCVPLSWYYAGPFNLEAAAYLADGKQIKLPLHPRYNDDNPVVTKDEYVRYVLDCPNSIARTLSPERIQITFKHIYFPIMFVFDATVLKNISVKDITEQRLPLIAVKYKQSLKGDFIKELKFKNR